MDERLFAVREAPLCDLIALAREGADALATRGADPHDLALADALRGAAAAVAVDIHEPARLLASPAESEPEPVPV